MKHRTLYRREGLKDLPKNPQKSGSESTKTFTMKYFMTVLGTRLPCKEILLCVHNIIMY